MIVFCPLALGDAQARRLREGVAADHLLLVPETAPEEAGRAACAASEIAFGNPPARWIADSPALRWVQLESVGFGEYLALDWERLGARLRVTNLAGFFADPVAETILAGILALHRGIDRLARLQDHRDWRGDALRPELRTLRGARVVLLGYGAINTRVAELLAPFACKTSIFRRRWTAAALDAALADADIVVSAVPDTPETRGIFDRARLGRMKRGAIFLNFGRGSAVDDDALADFLDAGALGGAVIDVTREEPLPPDHCFWAAPNMILTQHSGGGTGDEMDRKIDWFLDNLVRYRSGAPLRALVDFARGY